MPLYLMTYSELEVTHRIAVEYERATGGSDRARAIELFGEERAARYERLQRTAHSSTDLSAADAASDEIEQMEGSLTDAQQRRLFGIGEVKVVSPESVREYMDALMRLDYESPAALGASLTLPLLKLGEKTNPAEMTDAEQVAFAQVRAGLEYALEQGWSYGGVLSATLRGIKGRYQDECDQNYMAAPFIGILTQAGEDWARVGGTAAHS